MNTERGWGRWVWVAAVLGVLATVPGGMAAWAQQAPDPAARCAGPRGALTPEDREAIGRIFMNRTKERLGLTEQQAEEVRTVLRAMRDDARPDFQAMCEARLEMRRLLEQQDSDPAALKAAGDRVKAVMSKLVDRRLEAQIALRSKLTADQWAKWLELRKERGHRFMGRFRGLAS